MLPEILAIIGAILVAVSILPGTLGVLLVTSKIAAKEWGARLIYENLLWVAGLGTLLVASGWILALNEGDISLVLLGATALFAGTAVFGFFMHTKLMFQPVKTPKYMSVDEALETFGPDEEVVGVIDDSRRPWAYIARLARRPHIVQQPEGSNPFMMTHCILAHSSMAFATEDEFALPDITITSALANNLVFYEKNTKCSIVQAHNGALDGGRRLRMLPTLAVSLATWKKMYPDSKVWFRNKEWRDEFYLRLLARADVIDPNSPVMVYPLKYGLDERLPMKSMVTGVEIDGTSRTYTLEQSQNDRLIHDTLNGVDIVIVSAFGNDLIQVFDREVDGRTLTFRDHDGTQFTDEQTGSVWSALGECIEGELKGKTLKLVPHYSKMFWYVWADYHPGTEIYTPRQTARAAE